MRTIASWSTKCAHCVRSWVADKGLQARFARIANATARAVGTPWAFIAAASLVIGWAVAGPFFEYSDSWELVINTATTIITFLMVFLIQNTQNRDARALHLKIDELIFAIAKADNAMIDIESLGPDELEHLAQKFHDKRQHVVHVHDKKKPKQKPSLRP